MSQTQTLKPAEDRRVRDPADNFSLLTDAGKPVAINAYWTRRLQDGDVEIVPEPSKPAKKD